MPPQYDAATQLRDDWERAGVGAQPHARDLEAVIGSRQALPVALAVADLDAYERCRLAMRQVGRDAAHVHEAVVLHDEAPENYGRRRNCHGPGALASALDRLVRWYNRSP